MSNKHFNEWIWLKYHIFSRINRQVESFLYKYLYTRFMIIVSENSTFMSYTDIHIRITNENSENCVYIIWYIGIYIEHMYYNIIRWCTMCGCDANGRLNIYYELYRIFQKYIFTSSVSEYFLSKKDLFHNIIVGNACNFWNNIHSTMYI